MMKFLLKNRINFKIIKIKIKIIAIKTMIMMKFLLKNRIKFKIIAIKIMIMM